MRESYVDQFKDDYRLATGHDPAEGTITVVDDAKKWGIELRMFFFVADSETGTMASLDLCGARITYEGKFIYSINHNQLIWRLIEAGIGAGE